MAGYILKITLENTHPPIWRRVVVPEKITFRDLHDIIQILFGWDGYHLHCFENYTHGLMVDCLENEGPMSDVMEDKILIDELISDLPWIRYTYDFGDDWNHRIVYEKADPSYNLRHPSLLKYKGDNPMEDSGRVGPEMILVEFDPEYTQFGLESMEIPKRRKSGNARSVGIKDNMPSLPVNPMEELLQQLFHEIRSQRPALKNASDDELMNLLIEGMNENEVSAGIGYNDPEIQRQMELLDCGKPFTIVRTRKKIHQYLSEMEDQTIRDYIKYCRLEYDGGQSASVLLADFLLEHVEILYYFNHREEMKNLLTLRDFINSGNTVLDKGFQEVIMKCVCLGLIRLTGKRKLKLELCAEFDRIMEQIDFEHLQSIYDRIEEDIKTIRILVMAYASLSIKQFYQIYAEVAKKPMEQQDFERFIYWNGTMNGTLTTFQNDLTGENYLTLPDMKSYLKYLERRDVSRLFQAEPRTFSDIELRKWRKGLNVAIPEWDEYVDNLEECGSPIGEKSQVEEEVLALYVKVAAGMSLTELIMEELQLSQLYLDDPDDSTELLAWESDLWRMYAKLCVVTPIVGLNGYSREQYAQDFRASLDFVPLLEESVLKKRITKNTRIYEFPRDIQLDMIEALRKGSEAYERIIIRLCEKYKSNQALLMERVTIQSDKIMDEHPEYEMLLDDQEIIYPWSQEKHNLPKPSTYVRETKKVGRNDPCPCGSGRKYKQCCGR